MTPCLRFYDSRVLLMFHIEYFFKISRGKYHTQRLPENIPKKLPESMLRV